MSQKEQKNKLNVVTLCILEITKKDDKLTFNETKTMDVTHKFALSMKSFHFRPSWNLIRIVRGILLWNSIIKESELNKNKHSKQQQQTTR